MTIGIYALMWDNPENIYIGQSVDIERRWKRHKDDIKNSCHHSKRLQEFWDINGPPDNWEILEICKAERLNELEEIYISEFDSFKNGLNGTPGGSNYYGELHPKCKFSNTQIVDAFHLLVGREVRHKDISNITGVSLYTIRQISAGQVHTWLSSEYPEEYQKLLDTRNTTTNKIGSKHHRSTISEDKIFKAYELLVDRKQSLIKISEISGVPYTILTTIASGIKYRWLRDKFPDTYDTMLSRKRK